MDKLFTEVKNDLGAFLYDSTLMVKQAKELKPEPTSFKEFAEKTFNDIQKDEKKSKIDKALGWAKDFVTPKKATKLHTTDELENFKNDVTKKCKTYEDLKAIYLEYDKKYKLNPTDDALYQQYEAVYELLIKWSNKK